MADSDIHPRMEDDEIPETPEDVAVLYSWANMHGAKYYDFSASRREHRAQLRQKALEMQRESELRAAREREETAQHEEAVARRAASQSSASHIAAQEAEAATERARQSRIEAERHAHAAQLAEEAAAEAEREVEEARRRAAAMAARYAESDARRKAFAGPQPVEVPGEVEDPYHYAGHSNAGQIPGTGSGMRQALSGRSSSQYRTASVPVRLPAPLGEKSSQLVRDEVGTASSSYAEPHEPELQHQATDARYSEGAPRSFIPTPSAPIDSDPNWLPARHDDTPSKEVAARLARQELESLQRQQQKLEEHASGVSHQQAGESSRWQQVIEEESSPRPAFEEEARKQERTKAEEHARLQSSVSGQHAAPPMEQRRRREDIEPLLREKNEFAEAAQRAQAALQQAEEDRKRAEEARRAAEHDREIALERMRRAEAEERRAKEESRRELELRREASLREQYGIQESGFHEVADPNRNRFNRSPQANPNAREPVQESGSGSRPAWLYKEQPATAASADNPALSDTLQQSRERVAARWFALKSLMGQAGQEGVALNSSAPEQIQNEVKTPVVAVISASGGSGKTSIVATLGRVLSAMGEKVLLADTAVPGLLPYYFGSRELNPGVTRTFSPPAGSPDAPVHMLSFESEVSAADSSSQEQIFNELLKASRGTHRVLLDLHISSAWLVRRMAKQALTILVPLTPDMNSMLGMQSLERILGPLKDAEGRGVQPFYVLNNFDASLPLHLDMREAMRQMLGDRLLPVAIRRTPAISEALAEGMTVMDYAPTSAVAEDFTQLANWIRNATAPATTVFRGMRWSEG